MANGCRAGCEIGSPPLVEVLLARTRLHADLGQATEAEAVLARVAAIDPRRELDPGRFTPALVKSFAELRARQQILQGAQQRLSR